MITAKGARDINKRQIDSAWLNFLNDEIVRAALGGCIGYITLVPEDMAEYLKAELDKNGFVVRINGGNELDTKRK